MSARAGAKKRGHAFAALPKNGRDVTSPRQALLRIWLRKPPTPLLAPALFITLAALLLALFAPLYVTFEPRRAETAQFLLPLLLSLWLAVIFNKRLPYFGAVLGLLILAAVSTASQPFALTSPASLVWAPPILVVTGMTLGVALLLRPPNYLRRALIGVATATVVTLLLWSGPALANNLFALNLYLSNSNFPPFDLALDSQGTVYAVGAGGSSIWIFDHSGDPSGALQPGNAPEPPTPGPGILPNGMQRDLTRSGFGLLANPAAGFGLTTPGVNAGVCGLAVDPQDNLYTLLIGDPAPYKILKFDQQGNILAKIPLPTTNTPASGCLAADSDHLFVSTYFGAVYILDHQGNQTGQVSAPFGPIGLAPTHDGKLLLLYPNALHEIDLASGKLLPQDFADALGPEARRFSGVAVEQNGNILLGDITLDRIVRLDPMGKSIIGVIGGPGDAPGQLYAPGQIALDALGRIYVADAYHRVIQRFTAAGRIDAIWRAPAEGPDEQEHE